MTGIERLRDFARHMKDFSVWPGGQKLLDIADQIEREQDKVAQMDWDAVREVAADMASRVFMSVTIDELLCDWSRKLTDAADGHDHAKDVSMSAYDLLPADDRDAIAWVRRHGGVEALRRMFQDADSRRVELCGALGIDLDKGWSEAMATMLLRLMPEGMEWPRFEDGESVRVGDSVPFGSDAVMEVTGVEINRFGYVLHGSIDDGMRECVAQGARRGRGGD